MSILKIQVHFLFLILFYFIEFYLFILLHFFPPPGLCDALNSPTIFKDLMKKENSEALELYLSCAHINNRLFTASATATAQKSVAERSWLNIEKKLRTVVMSIHASEPESLLFLGAVELALIYFQTHHQALPVSQQPDSLQAALRKPLEMSDGKLIFRLASSVFNRLLLHAACQFHGLKSKSVESSVSKGPRNKSTAKSKVKDVHVSVSKSNKLFGHGVSLKWFLLRGTSPDSPSDDEDESGKDSFVFV